MFKFLFAAIVCLSAHLSTLGQMQAISNGNFSSNSGWVVLGNYWHISGNFSCNNTNSSPAYAFTGNANGSYTNGMFGSMYQQITIPANATSASLSYKVSINTFETSGTKDLLQCQIRSPSGNALLFEFNQLSNANGTSLTGPCQTYQTKGPFTIPTSYFGQAMRINFQVATDNVNATIFRIDDVSVTYTLPTQTGSIKVTITPAGAVTSGAQWNADGGAWQNSGAILNNMVTGNHTINFKTVNGWIAPASKTLTVSSGNQATASGQYNPQPLNTGSVQVQISPQAAVSDGAQWNLDGGIWQNNNALLTNVQAGAHTINFNQLSGWVSPTSRTVNVSNGNTSQITASYQPVGNNRSVSGTITHNGAGLANVVVTANPGNHSSTTGANGTYSLSVPSGWTGTLTPALAGYTFVPGSKSYTNIISNQTGQNFIATLISVAPTINHITFTNVIENHPGVTQNYELYSGSPLATNIPTKICADGSSATYISINASNTTGLNFRIVDESDRPILNSTTDGKLGNAYPFAGNNLEVLYTHPLFLTSTALYRSLFLQVLYNGSPVSGIRFPLHIYRPPIVFVHGLYGMGSTFRECASYLVLKNKYPGLSTINPSPLMQLVDYQSSGGQSFKTNRKIVPQAIDAMFINARKNKFSCGKVDVVAHSMGGILSRLYLQGAWDMPYRQDIHKLITLNTPHFGTQFANFVNPIINGVATTPKFELVKDVILAISGRHGTAAISDLRIDSREISDLLNTPVTSQNLVPSHTISTTKPLANAEGGFSMEGIAKFILKRLKPNLFHGEKNDLIVPLSSQQGGFSWEPSDTNQFHVGSSKSESVKLKVEELIDANPLDATHFSSNGFLPGKLNYRTALQKETSRMTSADSIRFTSPIANSVYRFGDSISVSIVGTQGITALFFCEDINNASSPSLDTSNGSLSIKIVPSITGRLMFGALGASASDIISADTTSIYISPPDSMDRLEVSPKDVELNLGDEATLSIKGIFAGKTLDIGNVTDLFIDGDTSKVQYLGNSRLLAKNLYDSTIIFTFRGKSDTIRVKVISSASANAAGFFSDRHRVCEGEQIRFFDDSKGILVSRTWLFPGGLPGVSNAKNPVVNYPSAGVYKVSLLTSFVNGTDTLVIDSLIEVNTKPVVKISGPNEICFGDSATLDAGSGFSQYLWSTGEGGQTISYAGAGAVTVLVEDHKGCMASDSFRLLVYPRVSPSVSVRAVSCLGTTIQLKASTVNGGTSPSFFWTISGAGSLLTADSVITVAGLADGTEIQCRLTSSQNCASPLQVISSPLTITYPKLTISGKASFCKNGFTTLTASGAEIYQWSNGSTSVTVNLFTPGPYSVVGTNALGCTDTSRIAVAVLPLPTIQLPASEIIVIHGERIRLGGSPTATGAGPFSYRWTPASGLDSDTVSNPFVQPNFNSRFQLQVTDRNGCTSTKETSIVLSGLYIYPNPSSDIVNIYGSKIFDGVYALKLFGGNGQLLLSKFIQTNAGLINDRITIKDLSAGVYFLSIEGPGGIYSFPLLKLQ